MPNMGGGGAAAAKQWRLIWWSYFWLVLLLPMQILLVLSSDDICFTEEKYDASSNTCLMKKDKTDKNDNSKFLQPNCGTSHTQTTLALKMARISCPRTAPMTRTKLQRILDEHPYFFIDLGGHQKLFDDVSDNMVVALEGYGLKRIHSMDEPVVARSRIEHKNDDSFNSTGRIKVETLFSPVRKDPTMETFYMNVPNAAVIIIQTEQVCCSPYGQHAESYLTMCHQSPNCIIWEYSYLNYQWLSTKGLEDSVVLLPTLHQHRLNSYYYNAPSLTETTTIGIEKGKVPFKNNVVVDVINAEYADFQDPKTRPIDVVFFGVMTPRRKEIQLQLQQIALQQEWNIIFEEVADSGSRLDYMADLYQRSKICLIVHSFVGDTSSSGSNKDDDDNTTNNKQGGTKSPGEYHRLSEMAPSGCLSVVETFGDQLGVNKYYRQCGGVIFSDLAKIPSVIHTILTTNYDTKEKLQGRVTWWNTRIEWGSLLKQLLEI